MLFVKFSRLWRILICGLILAVLILFNFVPGPQFRRYEKQLSLALHFSPRTIPDYSQLIRKAGHCLGWLVCGFFVFLFFPKHRMLNFGVGIGVIGIFEFSQRFVQRGNSWRDFFIGGSGLGLMFILFFIKDRWILPKNFSITQKLEDI